MNTPSLWQQPRRHPKVDGLVQTLDRMLRSFGVSPEVSIDRARNAAGAIIGDEPHDPTIREAITNRLGLDELQHEALVAAARRVWP